MTTQALPTAPGPGSPRPGLGRWRLRWQRWWLGRLPARDSLWLTHRNVYILPTRPGLMLALTLLLLLVGSINYQLNLGYLLTFLIAGSSVVAMHMAHRNLRGLRLSLQASPPVHAGQALPVQVLLHNPAHRQRFAIGLGWWPGHGEPLWVDVPAAGTHNARLLWPTRARGWQRLPPLQLGSRFPLGTFAVWSWWQAASPVLVYPAIEEPAPPLPAGPGPDGAQAAPRTATAPPDERNAIRPYRRGDAMKDLVWKLMARRNAEAPSGWVSRELTRAQPGELWLDSRHCGLTDTEAQRSRLCAWVLAAERQGWRYGLRLPGLALPPALGPAHCQRCLEALACH